MPRYVDNRVKLLAKYVGSTVTFPQVGRGEGHLIRQSLVQVAMASSFPQVSPFLHTHRCEMLQPWETVCDRARSSQVRPIPASVQQNVSKSTSTNAIMHVPAGNKLMSDRLD